MVKKVCLFFKHRKQCRVFAYENDPVWRHRLVIWEIKGRILRKLSLKRQEGIEYRGLGLEQELSLYMLCNGWEGRVHCCISHIVFYY